MRKGGPARGLVAVVVALALVSAGLALARLDSSESSESTLRVYFSTLLRVGTAEIRAMQLALAETDGRAGRFQVELVPLESGGDSGIVDSKVRANARRAAEDDRAIAYVGEDQSGATGISLPITNDAGLLHVALWAGYAGLTRPGDGEPGEPGRYYPTGRRTFARLVEHSSIEARALARWIERAGHRQIAVVDDGNTFGMKLELAVRERLADDVRVVNAVADRDGVQPVGELAEMLEDAEADAVVFCGLFPNKQYRRLAERLPNLPIYANGSEFDAISSAVGEAGAARDQLHVIQEIPQAQARLDEFSKRYERTYGEPPPFGQTKVPEAYEAMRALVDAIRRAGEKGHQREAVVAEFLATRRTSSLLGPFEFDAFGDITRRRWGGYMTGADAPKLVERFSFE